jgi:hypothetical protein
MLGLRAISIPAAIGAMLLAGEVIDRVAVVAGNQVITQSELNRELRMAALLNGQPVDLSPEAKRQAADRLVEQLFMRREMDVSRYGPPSAADTEALLEKTKKEHFPSEEAYLEALQKNRITEEELREHLQWQLMTVRFIDFRFRPGVQLPLEDIQDYYEQRFVPEWRKKSSDPPPPFSEARDDIEQLLTEQLVDQALDRWLNQQRTQTEIRYQEEGLR